MAESTRTIWDFWAPRYEGLWAQHFSLEPSRRLVLARLDEAAPDARRILDVGCGVGQLAHQIATRRPDAMVMGIDTSPAMVERARLDYSAPNLSYDVMPVEEVPHDGGFDVILSTHAFPYHRDKPQALRCMHALLRPGGRLLLVQANDEGLYDKLWLLAVKLTTTPAVYHSSQELSDMMEEAGFQPGIICSIDKPAFIPSIQLVEGIR